MIAQFNDARTVEAATTYFCVTKMTKKEKAFLLETENDITEEELQEVQDYAENIYTIKPTEKTTENQGKEISDCRSNEVRNVIQWAASGTKKREKEKSEADGADKIFMISNDIEEKKIYH